MLVHNISDRPNTSTEPQAIIIGRKKIRPGKFADIDDSFINTKVWALHGTVLWIGEQLPYGLRRTSRAGLRARAQDLADGSSLAMTVREAKGYLEGVEKDELQKMCTMMHPSLDFNIDPPKNVLVARISRALYTPGRVLDPEVFFWLRRWKKVGDTYIER